MNVQLIPIFLICRMGDCTFLQFVYYIVLHFFVYKNLLKLKHKKYVLICLQ